MNNANKIMSEIEIIQKKLHYVFANEKLLWQCLFHPSYYSRNTTTDPNDRHERFEAIGEAAIQVIADDIQSSFPDWQQVSFKTVNGQAVLANHLKIAEHIRAGKDEIERGLQRNQQVLSSTLKALVGVMYLESNSDIYKIRDWFIEGFGGKISPTKIDDPNLTKKQKKQIESLGEAIIHLIAIDCVYRKFDVREGRLIALAELCKKRMLEISEQHGYDFKYWSEAYLIELFSEGRDWLIKQVE